MSDLTRSFAAKLQKQASLDFTFKLKMQKQALLGAAAKGVGTGIWQAGKALLGGGAKALPKVVPKVAPAATKAVPAAAKAVPAAATPVAQTWGQKAMTWGGKALDWGGNAMWLSSMLGGESAEPGAAAGTPDAAAATAAQQQTADGGHSPLANFTSAQKARQTPARMNQGPYLDVYRGTRVPRMQSMANFVG